MAGIVVNNGLISDALEYSEFLELNQRGFALFGVRWLDMDYLPLDKYVALELAWHSTAPRSM